MTNGNNKEIWEDAPEDLDKDILKLQTDDVVSRTRLLENEIKILRSEIMRISHEHQSQKEKIKENKEKN